MTILFTPHTLGAIVFKLDRARKRNVKHKAVIVRRQGIRCSFEISEQPTLHDERIEWSATIASEKHFGKAGTVWDAARAIEALTESTGVLNARHI